MHSSVVFSRTASKSETLVPTTEETFEAGRCEQKVETAERGAELRPARKDAARSGPVVLRCSACAVAGRTAKYATQLPAASNMPANRLAQALRRIEGVVVVCDMAALELSLARELQ
jgi:hypothetical protein